MLGALLTGASAVAGPLSSTGAIAAEPMNEDRFWTIIGSMQPDASEERQTASLLAALAALSTDEIVAFDGAFSREMRRSYSWDLWGADYVIHGGASDDAFDYFRLWLISQGRGFFERALANPDDLADALPADVKGPLEREGLSYLPRQAWSQRTGRPAGEMPISRDPAPAARQQPAGELLQEDASHLANRYPKLWHRFGTHPLE
jgi:hypothetical protein